MAIPDLISDEATRPGGTGRIVTFYRLDCPKCGTFKTGDDVYEDWKEGMMAKCKCGYWGWPETRKVDLAA